jgi:hypothetical protein
MAGSRLVSGEKSRIEFARKKRQMAAAYNTRLRDADMRLAGSMRLACNGATIR